MGLNEEIFRLRNEVEGLEKLAAQEAALGKVVAAEGKVQAASGSANAAAGKYSSNLTALSYAVNDFASNNGNLAAKLNGVANNVPAALAGVKLFGVALGPVGLAIGAIIPVVALVIQNWDSLAAAFGKGVTSMKGDVDSLKKHIEELEKNPLRLAVDDHELKNARKELERLQTAAKAFEQFKGLKTDDQEAAGKGVVEALKNAPEGAENIAAAMKRQALDHATRQSQTLRDALAEQATADAAAAKEEEAAKQNPERLGAAANARAAAGAAQEKARKARAAVEEDADRTVGDVFKRAREGDDAGRGELADRMRAAGFGDRAAEVEGSNPAAVKAARQAKEKAKADKEAADRQKALDKETDDLNERGRENERVMREADAKAGVKEDRAEESDDAHMKQAHDAVRAFREKAAKTVEDSRRDASKAADKLTDPQTRLQLGTQGQIAEGTNGQLKGQALEDAAKRSIQLQEQGVNTQTANQQAAMETLALVNGLTQRYAMLQQNANNYLRQLRQVQRNMQQADQMTFQNNGGPN